MDALGEDSMMDSGGMIVMDEKTCMVDTAHYFVEFLEAESCGKCVPCREGTHKKVPHRHFVFSIPKVFEGISSTSSFGNPQLG
jgi:NADH:ubiquinone oxidoreductase subunit F (NADH-binding)